MQDADNDRTRVLARAIGPYLTLTAAAALYKVNEMPALAADLTRDGSAAWIAGALALAVGVVVVAAHSRWNRPAAILVSLFGWVAALKGLALMTAPTLLRGPAEAMSAHLDACRLVLAVVIGVGLYLDWVGWGEEALHPAQAPRGHTIGVR
ncbi:MAG: hypothetical protein ACREEW_18465 [Caulobacteraceae bacterium]